jgi:hypothetical protein
VANSSSSAARVDGEGAPAPLPEPGSSGATPSSVDADTASWRDGLLGEVTRLVVEAVLEAELTEHLRDAHDPTLSRRAYLRGVRGRGLTAPHTIVTHAMPGAVEEVAAIWPGTAVYLRAADTAGGRKLSARRVR